MSRRTHSTRRVKVHRNYSVDEVARLLGLHKNTIRDWIRRGLPVIDDQRRPVLVLGSALAEFIMRRRRLKKRPCSPGEIYCMRCRCPRHPGGDMADYCPITATSGNLVGICPVCSTLLYRRVSLVSLDAIRGNLEVRFPEAMQHIDESGNPSVNSDLPPE